MSASGVGDQRRSRGSRRTPRTSARRVRRPDSAPTVGCRAPDGDGEAARAESSGDGRTRHVAYDEHVSLQPLHRLGAP